MRDSFPIFGMFLVLVTIVIFPFYLAQPKQKDKIELEKIASIQASASNVLMPTMTPRQVFGLLKPEIQRRLKTKEKRVFYDGYMGVWGICNEPNADGISFGVARVIVDDDLDEVKLKKLRRRMEFYK